MVNYYIVLIVILHCSVHYLHLISFYKFHALKAELIIEDKELVDELRSIIMATMIVIITAMILRMILLGIHTFHMVI